ncbi:MAG: cytochrome c family protein [Caulobacteraceae bacterium]|nr:MAG: cytochrome c family protein [Caulobacteraceae bacterium]
MSDLTFNKIAAGVLVAGLAIFGLRELSGIVFEGHEIEKPGYAVAVVEDTGGGAAVEVAPDWGTVIPATDPALGAAVSAKCASCHTFTAGGANGTGPNLYGTMGKVPGTHPGFAYSDAMKTFGAGKTWTWDELDQFLKAPQKHVPGTKMTFVGLKKQEDRIAMLSYLHSLGSTLAVPAPKPAAAATEAPAAGATDPVATGTTADPKTAPGGATQPPASAEPAKQGASPPAN